MYEHFRFLDIDVRDDGVATIVMSRPEVLNAVDANGHKELSRILRVMAGDDRVRAVVISGAGRAFSIGGELDHVLEITKDPASLMVHLRIAREIIQSHIDFDRPVVAAINGYAMGAGLAFGLVSDYIIMDRDARIADGHTRAALAAGDCGALIWPLAVGLTRAKKYLLTGDWIDAVEAERIGLITEVVEPGTSYARALDVATRLAAGPMTAIRATKLALNQWLRLGQLASFDFSVALEVVSVVNPDVATAIDSLKRHGPGAIVAEDAK